MLVIKLIIISLGIKIDTSGKQVATSKDTVDTRLFSQTSQPKKDTEKADFPFETHEIRLKPEQRKTEKLEHPWNNVY